MQIPWFSTTVIQGLDLCGWRALTQHELRIEYGDDFTGSNPTRFGSIVHEVAETVHRLDAEGEASPDPTDLFDQIWRNHHLTDFDYFTLGRDQVSDFIDRTLFDRNGVTIATEWPFIIDMVQLQVWPIPVDVTTKKRKAFIKRTCKKVKDRGGVPVISMIDRIDRVSDTEYEIYDYKTNAMPFTTDEVENSIQLALYDMAVKSHWSEAEEVKCTFDMFRHGRQSTIFDEHRIEAIRVYIINLWHQVHNWDGDPLRTLNKYCGWCDFKQDCPVYAEALSGSLVHPFAADSMDIGEVFDEFTKLKMVEKLAKERAKEYGAVIMTGIMDENDGDPLPLDDERELYLQLNPRYDYPMNLVLPILRDGGALSWLKQVAKLSRPGLDRAMKGHKLADEIAPLLNTSFASPSIKMRKIKPTPKKKTKKRKKK